MSKHLTRNIFIALIFGALAGIFLPQIAPYVSWMGFAFKASLSMMVMPIIFSSILAGMANIPDTKVLGRIGGQTLMFFVLSALMAITVGMTVVRLIQPGVIPAPKAFEQALSQLSIHSQEEAPNQIIALSQEVLGDAFTKAESEALRALLIQQIQAGNEDLKGYTLGMIGPLNLRAQLPSTTWEQPKSQKDASLGGILHQQMEKLLVNPFKAMAEGDVLAVIMFALLLGIALHGSGASGQRVFEMNAGLNHALMQMVFWIMRVAPFGIFGLLVDVVSSTGPSVFQRLGLYVVCVLLGLLINFFILYPIYLKLFSNYSPVAFFQALKPAALVAFSTSSSKAALPVNLQCTEDTLKISPTVARFVLPLGANLNMNGTALYEAVAVVFIAQLYGVQLDLVGQITIGLMAALAAMGCAGIPASGTITMALVLQAAGLPLDGIGLILAVDRPLDMCRTVVNVVGETVGAAIIQKRNPDLV